MVTIIIIKSLNDDPIDLNSKKLNSFSFQVVCKHKTENTCQDSVLNK